MFSGIVCRPVVFGNGHFWICGNWMTLFLKSWACVCMIWSRMGICIAATSSMLLFKLHMHTCTRFLKLARLHEQNKPGLILSLVCCDIVQWWMLVRLRFSDWRRTRKSRCISPDRKPGIFGISSTAAAFYTPMSHVQSALIQVRNRSQQDP